jgi:hypothetical protein
MTVITGTNLKIVAKKLSFFFLEKYYGTSTKKDLLQEKLQTLKRTSSSWKHYTTPGYKFPNFSGLTEYLDQSHHYLKLGSESTLTKI